MTSYAIKEYQKKLTPLLITFLREKLTLHIGNFAQTITPSLCFHSFPFSFPLITNLLSSSVFLITYFSHRVISSTTIHPAVEVMHVSHDATIYSSTVYSVLYSVFPRRDVLSTGFQVDVTYTWSRLYTLPFLYKLFDTHHTHTSY